MAHPLDNWEPTPSDVIHIQGKALDEKAQTIWRLEQEVEHLRTVKAAPCATCLHAQWVTENWGWCEMAETTDKGHTLGSLARARTQEGKPASLHIERHYGCVQWEGKA